MPEAGRAGTRWLGVVALLIVIFVTGILHSVVAHSTQITLTTSIYGIIDAIAMTAFLAWLVPKIRLSLLPLALLLWLDLFAIEYIINYIEALFFTTVFEGSYLVVVMAVIYSAIISGVVAGSAALLLGQQGGNVGIVASLKEHFLTRTNQSWVLRIAVASVVYYPIYFFFGLLVAPFVLSYYSNPSYGLVIPSFEVMIPVEFLRGFLFVLALLPLLATLAGGRNTKGAALAAMLYIPGGFVALLGNTSLPPAIVPFHAVEILADSIVYGFVLSRILLSRVKTA